MVTKEQALTAKHFEHVTLKDAQGAPARCRANGKCQTWVTRPDEFKLPVKHGLRTTFYITEGNAASWNVANQS
jgi:hypothetical protein